MAKSIVKENNNKIYKIEFFKLFPGYGIEGITNNRKYFIGNINFMKEKKIGVEFVKSKIEMFQNKGLTTIFVADERKIIGAITLGDKIKDDSRDGIELLKKKYKSLSCNRG